MKRPPPETLRYAASALERAAAYTREDFPVPLPELIERHIERLEQVALWLRQEAAQDKRDGSRPT